MEIISEALSEKMIVKGLTVKSLNELSSSEKALLSSQAKSDTDALIALNTAFTGNGLFLQVDTKQYHSNAVTCYLCK
jgi:hypothetical protein